MRRIIRDFSALVVLIFTAALTLPVINTDIWWIRILDFPRIQFLIGLVLSLCLYYVFGGWRPVAGKALCAFAVGILIYQGSAIAPFILASNEARASNCAPDARFRVMVANVQKDNRLEDRFFQLVDETSPDILLILETDEWWDERLKELKTTFSHRHQHIPDREKFYGMHLLSKFELIDPDVKTYVNVDTPTIVTGVKLTTSKNIVFIGIHPRPPNVDRQPSTKRDANMMAAALDARRAGHPVVMAGDFNATPWERTTLLTLRIGGLQDPRKTYGLIPTYSAKSWAIAWPLDHIVHQRDVVADQFSRLPPFGSDHYAVVANLCLVQGNVPAATVQPVSQSDLEVARRTLSKAKAME